MKLNTKIVIVILGMGLIPSFLFGFIGYENTKNQIIQNRYTELDAIAQIQKNRLLKVIQDDRDMLGLLGREPILRANLREYIARPTLQLQTDINNDLLDLTNDVARIKSVLVANSAGKIIVSSDPNTIGMDVSTEEYFKLGIRQNDISVLKKDKVTGNIYHYLAAPLIIDGKTVGMLAFVRDFDDVVSISRDYTGLGDTGETLLAKKDGNDDALFVSPTRFIQDAALTLVVTKEKTNVPAVHAVNGEEGIFENAADYRGVPVFAATRFVKGFNWGVVVKIDQAEALAPINRLHVIFLSLTFATGLFIILMGILISRSITRPIRRLTAVANKIARGELPQTVLVTSQDEIGVLGKAFNTMVIKLKESYESLERKVRDRTRKLEDANAVARDALNELRREKSKVEALAGDLEKFKLAVDNASDQIIITDPEGMVIYVNGAVEKETGYKLEDVLGKKSGVLWKKPMPKEYYQEFWNTIKTRKKTFIGEIQNIKKNGNEYTAAISVTPVLDKSGEIMFFVGLERDVTKEKEVDKAKTEFVSLASHQLKTPPTAIKWLTEMLLDKKIGKLTEKQKKYLIDIHAKNEQMIKLINMLLDVSRIELGTFVIAQNQVDANLTMREVIDELKLQIKKKSLHLSERYVKQKMVMSVDANLLRMVIQNLLTNAINYTPEKGEITVEVSSREKGERFGERIMTKNSAVFTVADNGCGIPKQQQSNIFSKFFRADNARNKIADGTGLGLYIVKSILDRIGGEIWFTSEEDKGTTFYVAIHLSGIKVGVGKK